MFLESKFTSRKTHFPIFYITVALVFQVLCFGFIFAGPAEAKRGKQGNLVVTDSNIALNEDTFKEGQFSGPTAKSTKYSVVSNPGKGAVVLLDRSRGIYRYTPNVNAHGSDEFNFQATKGNKRSNVGTVFITSHPVNDAPIASNQSLEMFLHQ